MKTFLTDWRNPARWSRADRNRICDMASVSSTWEFNPFGISPAQTLAAIQPGVHRNNGVPVGGPYMREWGTQVDRYGWTLLNPDGAPVLLWQAGTQTVTAIDLTNPTCRMAWTETLTRHFNWAGGLHLDYYTSLGWIAPTIPQDFWTTWNEGWISIVHNLRATYPNWVLIGQQFHLTPITFAVEGLFLEESPGHFGKSFNDIARMMVAHGRDCWVIELRDPWSFPLDYRQQVKDFCMDPAASLILGVGEVRPTLPPAYLAWARDALALTNMNL